MKSSFHVPLLLTFIVNLSPTLVYAHPQQEFAQIFQRAISASEGTYDLHRRCADVFGLHEELAARGIERRAFTTVTTTTTTTSTLRLTATVTQTLSPVTTKLAATRTLYDIIPKTTTLRISSATTTTIFPRSFVSAANQRQQGQGSARQFGKAGLGEDHSEVFKMLFGRDRDRLERACRDLLSGEAKAELELEKRGATTVTYKRATRTITTTLIGVATVNKTLPISTQTATSTRIITSTPIVATRTTSIIATSTVLSNTGRLSVFNTTNNFKLGYLGVNRVEFFNLVNSSAAALVTFDTPPNGVADNLSISLVEHYNATRYAGPLRLALVGDENGRGIYAEPRPGTQDATVLYDQSEEFLIAADLNSRINQFRYDPSTKILTTFWRYSNGTRANLVPAAAGVDDLQFGGGVAFFADPQAWVKAQPAGQSRFAWNVNVLFESL